MTKPIEYRGYFFTNSQMISPLQQGLQTAHTVAEMFTLYGDMAKLDTAASTLGSDLLGVLTDWARAHKTIIILNGGNCASLKRLSNEIYSLASELKLPWGMFYEDEETLNNAITCVGIIVPSYIYHMEPKYMAYTDPDVMLHDILDKHKLAR